MSRAKDLSKKIDEGKTLELGEGINRISVSKSSDISKVIGLTKSLDSDFDKAWSKARSARVKLTDTLLSVANSVREVRIYLEDNFTLDPTVNLDQLPLKLQSQIIGLVNKLDFYDQKLTSIASSLSSSTSTVGLGKAKLEFQKTQKDFAKIDDLMKVVMGSISKSKLKL